MRAAEIKYETTPPSSGGAVQQRRAGKKISTKWSPVLGHDNAGQRGLYSAAQKHTTQRHSMWEMHAGIHVKEEDLLLQPVDSCVGSCFFFLSRGNHMI